MAQSLDIYDQVSIAEVVIYTFFLFGSIHLCIKHGFRRSSGWRFLLVLALARIIGSAMRLATISDPENESLYIGWITLNGVGVGPLVLLLVALLGRLFESINRQFAQPIVKPLYQRIIELLMLVAMVLLIIGGTNADYTIVDGSPKIKYTAESRAGAILMIVVLVFLIVQVLLAVRHQGYIAQGEHRVLIAVLASLPFVIVRLIYSVFIILSGTKQTEWLYIGAGVIMEMIVCLICQAIGFTLQKVTPATKAPENEQPSYSA